jgi:hypothetical protein
LKALQAVTASKYMYMPRFLGRNEVVETVEVLLVEVEVGLAALHQVEVEEMPLTML